MNVERMRRQLARATQPSLTKAPKPFLRRRLVQRVLRRKEAPDVIGAVVAARADLWWARVAERVGLAVAPVEPIDLTAPARTLVHMPKPPEPYDALAHTLQMRQALAEQERRDA